MEDTQRIEDLAETQVVDSAGDVQTITDEELAELDLEGFGNVEQVAAYMLLKQTNHEKFQKLTQQGVQIPPFQVMSIQFDVLLEVLGPEATAAWAWAFESKMAELLNKLEEDLPKMKLMQGMQPGQQQIPADIQKLITP